MLTPSRRPGAKPAADPNDTVGNWPWVSLNVPPAQVREWNALAKALGRSRADLWREVLEQVGLPYARGLAKAHRGALGRAPPPQDA